MAASAQIVTFGVKGGIPLTTAPFQQQPGRNGGSDTGRWTAGATVEFHITKALSVEVDALYRSYTQAGAFTLIFSGEAGAAGYSYRNDVRAWDFPLLLKYRFLHGPIRPFVDAGLSLTHESADLTSSCFGIGCSMYYYPSAGVSSVNANRRGDVAGGGVEFRWGRMTIAPEVRYARLINPGGNQTTLLVGFTF